MMDGWLAGVINAQAIVNGTFGAVVAVFIGRNWTKPMDTVAILVCGWAAASYFDVTLSHSSGLDVRICQFLLGLGGYGVMQSTIAAMRNGPAILRILTGSNGAGKKDKDDAVGDADKH